MDLNLLEPYTCVSQTCKKDSTRVDITNTLYYEPSKAPKNCPMCGEETIIPLQRICLVAGGSEGKFKASEKGQMQWKVKKWTYYCGRSNDEHNKEKTIQHTCIPEAATCPECLSQFNKTLVLLDNLLKVRS